MLGFFETFARKWGMRGCDFSQGHSGKRKIGVRKRRMVVQR